MVEFLLIKTAMDEEKEKNLDIRQELDSLGLKIPALKALVINLYEK